MPIDYSKYPPNWKTEIRPAVLARAENRCEHCGVDNYSINARGTKVVLTIAHLDHDSSNHDVQLDRLAALCQACHLKYDMARHVLKRKYGLDFFKKQLSLF